MFCKLTNVDLYARNDKDKRCTRAEHGTGTTSEFFVSQDVEFYKASNLKNIGYYDETVSIRRLCMEDLKYSICTLLLPLFTNLLFKKLSVAK